MAQPRRDGNQLVISYMLLRQLVGWIGTLLPVVLIAGYALSTSAPRPGSMSGYYYTDMRNVFVGALCALGVFLVAYDDYDPVDRWVTNVAGFAAIGVAFCPTKPAVPRLSASQQMIGDCHLFFAAVTFIALGVMALRFADGRRGPDVLVYRASGITILSCVALAAASNLLSSSVSAHWPLLFIFEAVAVFAFGVSWFAKGRTLDRPLEAVRSKLARTGPAPAGPAGEPAAAVPEAAVPELSQP
jgi:hypothetical protein